MDESKFIENFAEIFDDTDISDLNMDTEFKNLDEWSSLTALGLLAVMEEEYEADLSSKDIEKATTIRDIYNIVKG
ncbi:acyl carrier protein [Flavobacterium plurextorum]|uniref:Acyl carrier protein n=1 Tax=Flavobacterium plurextorum TaxID=1114867 RepID=A0ABX4CPE8_9FLAO|nr:phosphopantetheine-binding protein [Flavobacterium plurextorum]OXB01000.1 acyl carrier protein [Flavobacterium plurextorum]